MNNSIKIASVLIIFYLISNNLLAQNSNVDAEDFCVTNNQLIDSLINVTQINDKTILLSFGADAITAIKTQKGIVIIDAGISTGLTSKFRKRIETNFQENKFVYVINTHSHSDHYGGNSVFPEAKIVAQKNGLKEISAKVPGSNKQQRLLKVVEKYDIKLKKYNRNTQDWYYAFTQKVRYYYAFKDAKSKLPIKQPDITFSDGYKIKMGDVSFEMIYFGKCHSESDILIYVPELKLLFVGDLMFQYGRPSINDASMHDKLKWKQAILWIEKRMHNIEKIINGHGELLTNDDLRYFNDQIMEKISD